MPCQKLSYLQLKLQDRLFPLMEESFIDKVLDTHKKLAATLEVIKIEKI
jgi:hypothetical protein